MRFIIICRIKSQKAYDSEERLTNFIMRFVNLVCILILTI